MKYLSSYSYKKRSSFMESVSIDTISSLEKESVRREAHKHGLLGGPSGVCLLRECPSRERERMSVQRMSRNVCLSREGVMSVKRAYGGPISVHGISRERLSIKCLSRDSVGETVNFYACINLSCKSRKSPESVAV